jgi:hypothetical protein
LRHILQERVKVCCGSCLCSPVFDLKFLTGLLGAFAKLQKNRRLEPPCLSVCLSIRPFLRMELFGSQWNKFCEIWYLSVFRKSVEKIKNLGKYDRNNEYLTWRPVCVFNYFALISSQNEKYFDKICREDNNNNNNT